MRRDSWETYWPDRSLLSEMPAVSWVRVERASKNLGPHIHHAFEIVYVVRGSMDNWIGERRFRIGAGDVFVTPPGAVHGGVDSILHANEQGVVHVVFPPSGAALPGLDAADTAALRDDFAAMAASVFPGSPEIPRLIERILVEHRDQGRYSRMIARSALHQLLAGIAGDFRRHRAAPASGRRDPRIARLLAAIDRQLDRSWPGAAMASRCAMSQAHFRKLFARETGQSPAEWLARRRIERGKELLLRPRATVTAIAQALGFASGQYFATVFKHYAGMTPQEYRKASQQG